MLKAIKILLESNNFKKRGNHSVQVVNTSRQFTYHNTVICDVDDDKKVFHCNNGGWNTSSTTRAINDYRHYFNSIGYREC